MSWPAKFKTITRLFVATLIALSWLAISNHCALNALTASDSIRSASHCQMPGMQDTAPTPDKHNGPAMMECCKSLRALPAKSSAILNSLIAHSLPLDFPVALFAPALEVTLPVWSLDTGPPGSSTFAELVLQRSLRAHAPPSLA